MNTLPTCPTCLSIMIDKFDGATMHWLCPRCDQLTLMFVKEEQNFWAGQPDAKLIGYQWGKMPSPSPDDSA